MKLVSTKVSSILTEQEYSLYTLTLFRFLITTDNKRNINGHNKKEDDDNKNGEQKKGRQMKLVSTKVSSVLTEQEYSLYTLTLFCFLITTVNIIL
jgi:hypothetical protein